MTASTTYAALYNWIVEVTGYDSAHVIRANQEGPRPDDDYATFQITGATVGDHNQFNKVDIEGEVPPTDDLYNVFSAPMTLSVDVNVYAIDGFEKLSQLRQSSDLLVVRNIFKGIDATLIGIIGPIRDLSEIGDTEHRPRYMGEFSFRMFSTLSERNQKLKSFSIEGTAGGDTETIEGTF